jgi:hypothetical protein
MNMKKTTEEERTEGSVRRLSSPKRGGTAAGNSVVSDKEWKKAVFRRWDEFKILKRDVSSRLNEILASVPEEIRNSETKIRELKKSAEKLQKILEEIDQIDDSAWDRFNLSSELAYAMRKLENARMECLLFSSRFSDRRMQDAAARPASDSFIHEILSISFGQAFRLGAAFFLPLIITIFAAALLLAVMNYISLM